MGGESSSLLHRSETEECRKLPRKEGSSQSEYDYSDHVFTDVNDGHPAFRDEEREYKKKRIRRTRAYYRSKGLRIPKKYQKSSSSSSSSSDDEEVSNRGKPKPTAEPTEEGAEAEGIFIYSS